MDEKVRVKDIENVYDLSYGILNDATVLSFPKGADDEQLLDILIRRISFIGFRDGFLAGVGYLMSAATSDDGDEDGMRYAQSQEVLIAYFQHMCESSLNDISDRCAGKSKSK